MTARRLTFGTDPEFAIFDRNMVRISPDIIPNGDWWGHCRRMEFGADCDDSFEIRSGYHSNVIYVVNDIREILQKGYDTIYGLRDTRWIAGHYVDCSPLGGHIHIGNFPESFRISDDYYYHLNMDKIHRLTSLLGLVLIAGLSNKVDDLSQRRKRRTTGYGHRLDARCDNMRLEYRAPGSFLISPEITFINLILAKAIAELFCKDERIWNFLLERCHRKSSNTILKQIKYMIEHEPWLYREEDIQLGIESLDKLIKIPQRLELEWNADFKPNWGIGV